MVFNYWNQNSKKGYTPYLDVSFRDPTNPTALVKLIAVDGETSEILEKRK